MTLTSLCQLTVSLTVASDDVFKVVRAREGAGAVDNRHLNIKKKKKNRQKLTVEMNPDKFITTIRILTKSNFDTRKDGAAERYKFCVLTL